MTTGRKYLLAADTEEEHQKWLDGLKKLSQGDANAIPAEPERKVEEPLEVVKSGLLDRVK